ncbi:MAG: hypothetical protein ACREEC_00820, partial [Thermoplasmata archaeon]
RLVLDAPAPTSLTEATALADGAKAIVTSPSHVTAALNTAGVVRDPVAVIRNITLVPQGTSGVLQLSVQDQNAAAAASIANALADDLIKTRLAVSPAAKRAALDDRITSALDQIAALDQKIAALSDQLQSLQVDPSNVQTVAVRAQILADQITADSNLRSALTQQELQLESERNSLASSGSVPTPDVIDRASAPAHPDPSRLPIALGLALVIGVILGVAAASILETFGPTLSTGEAIADALEVPMLGWLPDSTGALRDRLTLAASATDVGAVELLSVGGIASLSDLARGLHQPGQADGKGLPIFSAEDAPAAYRNGASSPPSGFVVVTPERIRKAALTPVKSLLRVTGRPLLGVVIHTPERSAGSTGMPQERMRRSPRLAIVQRGVADPLEGMSKEVASDLWGGR